LVHRVNAPPNETVRSMPNSCSIASRCRTLVVGRARPTSGLAVIFKAVRAIALVLVGLALTAASPAMPAPSERPRESVDTDLQQPTGRTVHVPAGGDLQAALNTARLGDVITLEAGITYTGPFLLPRKQGTGWLVVRTTVPDARLQPGGSRRVSPALAPLMPHLVAARGPVVSLALGAHHYRFIGIEISPTSGTYLQSLVSPAADPRSDDDQPHHVIFDRCYLHGDAERGTRRAIVLNGRHLAVIHSYLSDFKEAGADSQALVGWNGSGPFKIEDNYLEGAAENVMFGGADPSISGLVPSDIEIRGNTFAKNLRWNPRDPTYDGSRWSMKNLFELKNARRVLIEGNLFENYAGLAILITPRNQSGTAPWSTVEDVTIRYNWIRQVHSALNISGYDEYHPSQPTKRITVEHNVAERLYDSGEPNPKLILINQGPDDVAIRHNTLLTTPGLGSSCLLFANAATKKGNAFVFTDNIVHLGTYGIGAENPSLGTTSVTFLDGHFTAWTLTRNVLITPKGGPISTYPAGQHWESSIAGVGFQDPARQDFKLTPRSRYKNAAEQGSDPGPDINALREAFNRVMSVPGPITAQP